MPYFLARSLYTHSVPNVRLIPEYQVFSTLILDSSAIDDGYSRLLLERDSYLFLALEKILADIILADVSDYGVDLAVGRIFASYQAGTQRWVQLQCPNARWLTCKTKVIVDQPSQIVHINLLDGALRVNGQLLDGLPRDVREIFRDVCTCFISYVNERPTIGCSKASLPYHPISQEWIS